MRVVPTNHATNNKQRVTGVVAGTSQPAAQQQQQQHHDSMTDDDKHSRKWKKRAEQQKEGKLKIGNFDTQKNENKNNGRKEREEVEPACSSVRSVRACDEKGKQAEESPGVSPSLRKVKE